ncbi:hypothetical protein M2C83_10765 [Cupriavidus basilensis]|nr:hypothetical protein [Cupriavidus basilensis]MCP3019497.1 hypothetical protein [Cupriavidus basilensis]
MIYDDFTDVSNQAARSDDIGRKYGLLRRGKVRSQTESMIKSNRFLKAPVAIHYHLDRTDLSKKKWRHPSESILFVKSGAITASYPSGKELSTLTVQSNIVPNYFHMARLERNVIVVNPKPIRFAMLQQEIS